MTTIFSWIHISDIHVGHGPEDHRSDQLLVLGQLKGDIERMLAGPGRVPRPDAILVTGDIAFSGDVLRREYGAARLFLADVARIAGLGVDKVFTVPGNHDVQRTRIETDADTTRLLNSLRGGEKLDDALERPSDRNKLELRFNNYRAFASELASPCQDLFWVHMLPTDRLGVRVRLVGLNTAILCNDDKDHGVLQLGNSQILKAFIPRPNENELTIVMSHHPLRGGWLADEKSSLRWIGAHAHVHLSGHVHEASNQRVYTAGGADLVEIAAGAVHGEKLPNGISAEHGYSFGAVVVSRNQLKLRVWPRLWSKQNDFRPDINNIRNGQSYADHVLRLKVPKLPSKRSKTISAHTTPRRTPIPRRDLRAEDHPGISPVIQIDLMQLGDEKRFQDLCTRLARRIFPDTMPIAFASWDGKRSIVAMMGIRDNVPVSEAVWQTKFTDRFDAPTKQLIRESIATIRDLEHTKIDRWILCVPVDPTDAFIDWLTKEVPETWRLEVWGATAIRELLQKNPDLVETFFYATHEELQQFFAVENIELVRFMIDPSCQWLQADPQVLHFSISDNVESPDLVLDIIVRNSGEVDAILLGFAVNFIEWEVKPHGIPGSGLLFPQITYEISINHGRPGTYRSVCEPPLIVRAGSVERFKIRVRDTGYAWRGTIAVTLDFGNGKRLRLPFFRLYA
ncbi:metallophosphoesterase [Sorangium sp. So ce302]|uniref:metallophosphoesterase family protein n=1 Tax=Sorangium sp. So ce302 TaxID=3133297 RepID=UPI003F63E6E8